MLNIYIPDTKQLEVIHVGEKGDKHDSGIGPSFYEWLRGFCFEDDALINYKGHCNDAMIRVELQLEK